MSRSRGTFNFSANFEVMYKAPLDARQLVSYYSGLTASETWLDGDGNMWIYDGMLSSVVNDPDSTKNGLYFLRDAANYNINSNWIKLGDSSISGFTNVGTGVGVYSGITDTGIVNLRTIKGSGDTTVSIIGDEIIVNSVGSGVRNIEVVDTLNFTATTANSVLLCKNVENIYLPSTPYNGMELTVVDGDGDGYNNNITIHGNGKNISGVDYQTLETIAVIDSNWGSITFIYNGTFWSIISYSY